MLARTTRDEMLRPWIVSDETWHEAQGLCFYWVRKGEERYVGHAGGLHGFITRFALSPQDGAGAIALLNGMGDANALAFELLDEVVAAQRARPLPQPAPPQPLPAAYAGLLGRYHWEEFAEVFVVEWRDGELVLTEGDEIVRMEPTDDPLTVHDARPATVGRPGAVPARRRRPGPPGEHRRLSRSRVSSRLRDRPCAARSRRPARRRAA